MSDGELVVDSSAVIALLVGEPFGRFDPDRVAHSWISAVNLSEVLARLNEIAVPEREAAEALGKLDLRVAAFDEPSAHATARLRAPTRRAGLSLGDRACLALAQSRRCPAVTADRVWANLSLGISVILIR